MEPVAREIVESALVKNDEMYRQYSDLRDYLRETKLHVPREMWGDLESLGGYDGFRRANMSRLRLSSAEGAGIDSVFQELSDRYPEFFDENRTTTPAEQLTQMADVLDGLQPVYENPHAAALDTTVSYAMNDILDGLLGEEVRQSPATYADRWRRDGGNGPAPERQTAPAPAPTPPAPSQMVSSAPAQSTPRSALAPVDVTQEDLDAAKPGQGSMTYETGYEMKKHQSEISIANWLHRIFGGDIQLLKEAKNSSVIRPDYLWNKALWELKGAHSISAADKRLQYAIKQIKDSPGWVILDILEDMDMKTLEQQLVRRFYRNESEIKALDLMILLKDDLVKILRYKK